MRLSSRGQASIPFIAFEVLSKILVEIDGGFRQVTGFRWSLQGREVIKRVLFGPQVSKVKDFFFGNQFYKHFRGQFYKRLVKVSEVFAKGISKEEFQQI